jgi:hypothetical protein
VVDIEYYFQNIDRGGWLLNGIGRTVGNLNIIRRKEEANPTRQQ